MNKLLVIILLAVIYSCSSKESIDSNNLKRVPVELHKVSSDASLFIEKIELTTLETNDSSLINGYKKTIYDKELDIYVIYGKNQIVQTFSGDGKFIASSRKVRGDGPQEYNMAIDVKVNSFRQGIDLLNPYGVIYTYSPTFEFVSKKAINPDFFMKLLLL